MLHVDSLFRTEKGALVNPRISKKNKTIKPGLSIYKNNRRVNYHLQQELYHLGGNEQEKTQRYK